jgi:hypothetical protein
MASQVVSCANRLFEIHFLNATKYTPFIMNFGEEKHETNHAKKLNTKG